MQERLQYTKLTRCTNRQQRQRYSQNSNLFLTFINDLAGLSYDLPKTAFFTFIFRPFIIFLYRTQLFLGPGNPFFSIQYITNILKTLHNYCTHLRFNIFVIICTNSELKSNTLKELHAQSRHE